MDLPSWDRFLERHFRAVVIAVLLILVLVVYLDDSDGFVTPHAAQGPFYQWLDTTAFHHEHVAELLALMIAIVALWPQRVEASYDSLFGSEANVAGAIFIVGILLLAAGLLNLPDNSRVFPGGGMGVNAANAYLGGQVLNDTGLRQPLPGVTVNYAQGGSNGTVSGVLVSDANGSFSALLPTGLYSLRLSKAGFQTETISENNLPSRGGHVVVYLSPLNAAAAPAPVVNTNATNTPPPPATWWANSTYTCLYSTSHVAGNGSAYLSCVVKIGPWSSLVFVVGDLLMLAAAMIGVAYGGEQGELGEALDAVLILSSVLFLASRFLVPFWLTAQFPLILFVSWYVTLFGLSQVVLPRILDEPWDVRHAWTGLGIVLIAWALGAVLYVPGTTWAVLVQGQNPLTLPSTAVSLEAWIPAQLWALDFPGPGTVPTNVLLGSVVAACAAIALLLWVQDVLKDESVPKVSAWVLVGGAVLALLPLRLPPMGGFSLPGVFAYAIVPAVLLAVGVLLVWTNELRDDVTRAVGSL